MKKLFVILASLLLIVGVSSCTCSSQKTVEGNDCLRQATVENLISLDRQSMYANYAEDYRWFETGIQLVDFLDEEDSTADGEHPLVFHGQLSHAVEDFCILCRNRTV